MAAPGYGKRSAPGQPPRRREDFAHLPPREASIAAHIDRLPDGAAIDTKTLARELPAYGQQAVRSALAALSQVGHLRRIRETVSHGRTQWVYRTYFSRTPRTDAWWASFLAGGTPAEPEPVPEKAADTPRQQRQPAHPAAPARPPRSDAYDALAGLGRADPRMVLSATDCAELEALAAEWLARGTTKPQLIHALTDGLPPQVHSPGALARRRLTDKLPPEPVPIPVPPSGILRRIMECISCGRPGRPAALPGGLCRTCRGGGEPSRPADATPPCDIHARVERLRAAVGTPGRSTP